jgi:RNA polymerase sigma-70 factor (ECF subfamily)
VTSRSRAADAPNTDDALVTRARAGDARALETLLDRHADRIHAICRRVLGNPEDALDATQEALIAVARGVSTFDSRSTFTTWLYRVATNAALDEGRRVARRPRPVETPPERAGDVSPEDAVGARIDIDAALAALPEEFRVAVVLRDLCDLDYAEIADVLGVPPGTVRSRIARGRAALAEVLGNPDRRKERPSTQTTPMEP